jgi:hypothetical protein
MFCLLLLLLLPLQNLSEEVDMELLFDFFSQFGEIYQCKTDSDLYGQYFGQVRGCIHQQLASTRNRILGVHVMVMGTLIALQPACHLLA